MKTSSRTASLVRLTGGVTVLLLASIRCQVALDPQPLQRFETCEDLQVYLEDQILHPSVEQSFVSSGAVVGCADALGSGAEAPGDAAEGEGERAFSETTTQEEDVDEPDFVKNNGDLIFVLRRGEMIILGAFPPADMGVLSRTQIAGRPTQMFFDDEDDRVLVISNFVDDAPHLLVKLFDVSDPRAPVELRSTLIDGTYVNARSVGSEVMLVSSSFLTVNVELDTAAFSDDENRARLRAAGLGRILPKVSDFIVGKDTAPRVDNAAACENTYAPSSSDGRSILLVHGFDMADETAPLKSTGVVAPFSNVYASTRSLYLASTEIQDGGYFTPPFATTRLHKLTAFSGKGAAEYQATSVIRGTIQNELSMDEGEDGLLRVVVTDNVEDENTYVQSTSLVVLEQLDESTELSEVARVEDIGRGENVESVRFVGKNAYVVTYPANAGFFIDKNGLPSIPFTDPLFVIDLSDGRAPRLRGSIEVDGYSAYIHPIDDTHLLTVGVNTDESTGAFLGLSLLSFDVSNPDAPALLHRYDFGNADTGSEALFDRHAFMWFSAESALAIPVQRRAPNFGALLSSGLAVFRYDADDGFLALGEVGQTDLYPELTDGTQTELLQNTNTSCASVRRSVMISDPVDGAFVYAISTGGVSAARLDDGLEEVATVNLRNAATEPVCDAEFNL
jgi:hypothetical protein